MGKTLSIRAQLQGELIDFLNDSGIACIHIAEFVRDITCLLASYREEDVPMFPDVFVLTDPANLASISPGPPLPGKLTPLHPDHFHHQGA
jgi:hypothetical protein